MTLSNESIKRFPYIEVLSFIIPVIIVALAYIGVEIYPGSRNMVMTYDLRSQIIALYGYLSNQGSGYDNMIYSMSGALGGGFFGSFAYYYTPLDLVYCFVPVKYLPTALYFMILVKFGLIGLSCSIYLQHNGLTRIPDYMTIALACCYSLMSYNFMYCMMPMWIDAVILLPLLALSLEKIIRGGKSKSFIILLSLCIVCNYYTAYMNVIAIILYFIFRTVEEKIHIKKICIRTISFSLHGMIGAGMAMFMIVPVLIDYERGKLSQGSVGLQGDLIKNSLSDVFRSFISQSYAGLGYNASPNIFCGTIVLILALCWLIIGKSNINTKIASFTIILFYFASFIYGPLDRVWHGFREPVCFSVRYSYTFVFFIVIFAARGLYNLLGLVDKKDIHYPKIIIYAALIFTFSELYINGSYIFLRIATESGYTYGEEYIRNCRIAENIIPYDMLSEPDKYGRIIKNYSYSYFDSALYGYDGIERYSSSYNREISEFLRDLGLGAADATIKETGITPPVSGLFNVRYIASFVLDKSDLYIPISEYKGVKLYEDEYSFPLAFETEYLDSTYELFDANPFDNVNQVYRELLGAESDDGVFKNVEFIIADTDDSLPKNSYTSTESIKFTASEKGHYYVFVEYITDKDETKSNVIRDLYLDGENIGTYGNNVFTNCVDLGELGNNEEHYITFAASSEYIGRYYLYYFDFDRYKELSSNVNGFALSEIGKNGITFTGRVDKDTGLFISLPYEKGYKVWIDGVMTEPISYRDCLMILPVDKGNHVINIKYSAPGMRIGIVISIASFIVFLYLAKKQDQKTIR